jgi:formylglycine-generating enzyme required for sulfatase activity
MSRAHARRFVLLSVSFALLAGIAGCHSSGGDVAPPAVAPAAITGQAGLHGDLNGSGTPDITDAVGVLRIIVGLDPANALADCDCDSATGITDAIALLRCLVGLAPWPIACGLAPGDETTGPDGQTLVWVPAGSFMMGSEDGLPDERPVHQVTLDGFWIGQCEVTNAQYAAFCDATGLDWNPPEPGDHPVMHVNWYDAQEYCDYYGYTLPTEAQWEYAARGPAVPTYPWGNEWDAQKCCNWDNWGPGADRTFPAGSFPAGESWCGALDMAGNVCEWCADWYSQTYYQVSPEVNPPGPESGTIRVCRGGSWYMPQGPDYCRTANRGGGTPQYGNDHTGFRVARSHE